MLLSILIVNYNSSRELLEVVAQLENDVRLPKGFEKKIFIVENGSTTPGEWETLQVLKEYPDVNLFISEKNLGFTGGNNFLIEKANALNSDYFLLLNPDTAVDKNFIVELLKINPDVASPKIYFYKGYETHPSRYKKEDFGHVIWYGGGIIDWDNVVGYHRLVDTVDVKLATSNQPLDTDFCTGCCTLISKDVMEKLHGLDNKYFLNLEDLDFSVRAKRAGFDTLYVPKAIIWHKNAVSKGGVGSPVEDYWQTRNRLIFAFKYAKLKTKILLLWQLVKTADKNRWKAIFSAFT
ncbi:glycosyltransferase family 2 protein [Candidatus Microgenomates bacterium]|nr:glycosyltransferase family 2 protein [Candidatus Microgenomates bacterium]